MAKGRKAFLEKKRKKEKKEEDIYEWNEERVFIQIPPFKYVFICSIMFHR